MAERQSTVPPTRPCITDRVHFWAKQGYTSHCAPPRSLTHATVLAIASTCQSSSDRASLPPTNSSSQSLNTSILSAEDHEIAAILLSMSTNSDRPSLPTQQRPRRDALLPRSTAPTSAAADDFPTEHENLRYHSTNRYVRSRLVHSFGGYNQPRTQARLRCDSGVCGNSKTRY